MLAVFNRMREASEKETAVIFETEVLPQCVPPLLFLHPRMYLLIKGPVA